MGDTFQSVAVAILAVLPGALYTWAFEREAGSWGVSFSDRALRFLGASALFHATFAAGTYEAYREFVVSHKLSRGSALPWWTWLLVLLYVAVPVAGGYAVGAATKRRERWATLFTGPSPAPRAYDYLFSTRDLAGWVRIRLNDGGGWVLGVWGAESGGGLVSYASGYPEAEEVFLADTAEADSAGNFLLDADGEVQMRGVAALIRLDQTAYLEFIEG